MEPEPLTQDEVDRALAQELPHWSQDGDALVRSVEAPSFLEGIELVRRVAQVAEELDHHPDIDIRWRKVTLALVTHDAGGLTWRDTKLAAEADTLFAQVVKQG